MPSKLADVLINKPTEFSADTIAESDIDPEYLTKCLEALDPEDFRDQDEWLKLMMACHEASGGLAEAEFIEWSTSDPVYTHDTDMIRTRWRSLGNGKGPRITRRTLFKYLAEIGHRELIPKDSDVLPNSHAMTIAKAILEEMPRTVRCNAQWYQFNRERNVYVQQKEEAFKAAFWNLIEGRRYLDDKGNTRGLVSRRHTVADVMEAAMALCMSPGEPHCWLDPKPSDPPADEIIVCANGLLHLPTRKMLPATNQFVGVNSTPIAYDPNAREPQRFVQFLREIFPNEADCREGLMEVAGLLLTRDTSYQKIFQLVGPTRSGKGTLMRVILSLVGDGNHTSPSTSNLSGRFGLAPLINKQVAVLADMRMGARIDRSNLLETLLRVSGEDPVSIERKGIDNIEPRLTTRFVLVSNETLQLRDTADAIGARMILFVIKEKFRMCQDPSLGKKLELELPGILNMALDGLERLRERGHFLQPKSASAEVEMMHRLTSPVKAYIQDRLIVGAMYSVSKDMLYRNFEEWCNAHGIPYTGGEAYFYKDLKTAGLNYQETRPNRAGVRIRELIGVGLKTDHPF